MEASRYSIGTGDSPLPDCGFTRSGYRFVGWAFEADAAQAALTQGATLEDAMKQGGSHILYQNVTLYAVWEQEEGDQQHQEDGPHSQKHHNGCILDHRFAPSRRTDADTGLKAIHHPIKPCGCQRD